MNEYNPKTKNPVARAANELGGQKNLARMIAGYGLTIHRQAVYRWTCLGYIPSKYGAAIRDIARLRKDLLSDPKGLVDSIKDSFASNGKTEFPNQALKEWVDSKGGISLLLSEVNFKIDQANIRAERSESPLIKKWTYVMIHNWLKRGRVSDDFQDVLHRNFDCPREIMEMPSNKLSAKELTAEDILG